MSARPGGAAGPDLPAHRRRRGDGRGAAPGRVQPQHQGAGRLLGRAVHRRRRAAGPGRAHPGAPRVDAGVGARPPSTRSATDARGRASRSSSTTRSPAAPTSTTSRWWRRASSTAALVGWAANRAHHADVGGAAPGSIPRRRHRDPAGGPAHPAGRCSTDGRRARSCSPTRARPTSGAGDLDAQVGANVVGVERLAALAGRAAATRCVDYGERRMRAALAALPDGTWTFDDVLDSTGPGRDQQRPAPDRASRVTVDGDEVDVRLHRHRRRSAPGNVNAVEAVTVSAVAFALRSAVDPTIPANGGALRPVRSSRPPGTIVAARPPAAVGAGNVEVSQRVADVCLGALAQAVPDRVRRGVAGDDEQPPHRRRRLGVLRDRRRRAGRPPRPRRA